MSDSDIQKAGDHSEDEELSESDRADLAAMNKPALDPEVGGAPDLETMIALHGPVAAVLFADQPQLVALVHQVGSMWADGLEPLVITVTPDHRSILDVVQTMLAAEAKGYTPAHDDEQGLRHLLREASSRMWSPAALNTIMEPPYAVRARALVIAGLLLHAVDKVDRDEANKNHQV